MTTTDRRRYLATADFHDRIAREAERFGKPADATAAREAAEWCRKQVSA